MAHLPKAFYQLGGHLPFAQLEGHAGAVACAGLVFTNFVEGYSLHFQSIQRLVNTWRAASVYSLDQQRATETLARRH